VKFYVEFEFRDSLCANKSETRNPSTIAVWAGKEISH
jgi:hypothetical protein